MVIVSTIITVLQLIKYLMLPVSLRIYGEYHGYFSLTMLAITVYFLNRNKFYSRILRDDKRMSIKERRILTFRSWAYIAVVVFGFFYLGSLLREAHLFEG